MRKLCKAYFKRAKLKYKITVPKNTNHFFYLSILKKCLQQSSKDSHRKFIDSIHSHFKTIKEDNLPINQIATTLGFKCKHDSPKSLNEALDIEFCGISNKIISLVLGHTDSHASIDSRIIRYFEHQIISDVKILIMHDRIKSLKAKRDYYFRFKDKNNPQHSHKDIEEFKSYLSKSLSQHPSTDSKDYIDSFDKILPLFNSSLPKHKSIFHCKYLYQSILNPNYTWQSRKFHKLSSILNTKFIEANRSFTSAKRTTDKALIMDELLHLTDLCNLVKQLPQLNTSLCIMTYDYHSRLATTLFTVYSNLKYYREYLTAPLQTKKIFPNKYNPYYIKPTYLNDNHLAILFQNYGPLQEVFSMLNVHVDAILSKFFLISYLNKHSQDENIYCDLDIVYQSIVFNILNMLINFVKDYVIYNLNKYADASPVELYYEEIFSFDPLKKIFDTLPALDIMINSIKANSKNTNQYNNYIHSQYFHSRYFTRYYSSLKFPNGY